MDVEATLAAIALLRAHADEPLAARFLRHAAQHLEDGLYAYLRGGRA